MNISFVMPVYKGKDIILDALDRFASTKGRMDGDELIVVFDGDQEDEAYEKAISFAKEHPYIKVHYPKARMGAFMARKYGIEHAFNDYIGFIDADDGLVEDGLEKLHALIDGHPDDIINFSFFTEKNGKRSKNLFVKTARQLNQKEAFKGLLGDSYIRGFLWTKLYKKEILNPNDLISPRGVDALYEDTLINLVAFLKAKTFYYDPTPIYSYHKDDDESAVSKPRINRTKYHLAAFASCRIMLEKNNRDLLEIFFKSKIRNYLSILFDLSQDKKFGLDKNSRDSLKKSFKNIFNPKESLSLDPEYAEYVNSKLLN